MPTENRSSNTAKPFEREDRYIVIKRSDLDLLSPNDRDLALTDLESIYSLMSVWDCPVREFLVIESDWPEFEPAWAAIEARVNGKPAQHQGEPVALPKRKPEAVSFYPTGWNACLDEIAKLGPLYTRADPGEVERLRADLVTVKADRDAYAQNAIDLRTQLAERDKLLRVVRNQGLNPVTAAAIRVALSASVDPSAPVERGHEIPGTSFQRLNALANQGE